MTSTQATDEVAMLDHADEKRSLAQTALRKYFEAAAKYEASDLLLRAGQVPKLRLRGELKSLETEPLELEAFLENAGFELLSTFAYPNPEKPLTPHDWDLGFVARAGASPSQAP